MIPPRPPALFTAAALLGLAWISAAAHAVSVRGIRSRVEQPLALRNGIMLLPLTAERAGDHWPSATELTLLSGPRSRVTLKGEIAWIEFQSTLAPLRRRWTDDPRNLRIRAIQPDDDSSSADPVAGTGPYLLIQLPAQASGELLLGKQRLKPVWRDLPGSNPLAGGDHGDEQAALTISESPDRPDPESPFEYWRWTLLADRLGLSPPAPRGSPVEQLAAEHFAQLWRVGLTRLYGQSERLARECRDLMVHTCIDANPALQSRLGGLAMPREGLLRRQPVAAWLADVNQINSLLGRLLDFSRSDSDMLADAAAWFDAQEPVYVWPEAEHGPTVRMAAITPLSDPVPITLRWEASDAEAISTHIEPGVLTHLEVARMPLPTGRIGMPAPPEPQQQVLIVECRGRTHRLTFGPRVIIAKPPAVFFPQLAAPLTLAEVQARGQRPAPAEYTTSVQLRRLGGRWEVFAECHRPEAPVKDAATDVPSASTAPPLNTYDNLRGIEALTLLIGDDAGNGPAVWLTVPERGWLNLVRGSNDGSMQVHRQSRADRWYCRIVLPDHWMPVRGEGPALIGIIRSHGDSNSVETGPGTSVPWRIAPPRAAIDTTHWDDMPSADAFGSAAH
jgi:hypothetical protein